MPQYQSLDSKERGKLRLKINITDSPPDQRLPTIYHEGYYYSVNDTIWDRTTYIGVTQIAHRLGVSPATLYRYIPAARTANTPGV